MRPLNISPTGQSNRLMIASERQVASATHPREAMLRASDKATSKELGSVLMPAAQNGSPITYLVNGSSTSSRR